MTIRIRTEELDEFKSNFTKIKNNIEELCGAMDKVTNKVVLENIIAGSALISDVEKLNGDIYKLKEEIEYYIHDIDLLVDEFKNTDLHLKESSIELKNIIEDMLRKSKNSFIPATYSINSSICSEENEKVMSLCGVNDKSNQTIELTKYNNI